jgi:hypothetical protein
VAGDLAAPDGRREKGAADGRPTVDDTVVAEARDDLGVTGRDGEPSRPAPTHTGQPPGSSWGPAVGEDDGGTLGVGVTVGGGVVSVGVGSTVGSGSGEGSSVGDGSGDGSSVGDGVTDGAGAGGGVGAERV